MDAEVLSQPSVIANINVNYVPVKVNADNFPATAQRYGVSALPTTVILTPQGQLLDSIRGRMEAMDLSARLNQVAMNAKQRGAAPYAQMPPANGPTVPGATAPAVVATTAAAPVVASPAIGAAAATSPAMTPPAMTNTIPAATSSNAPMSLTPGATPATPSSESRYADFMQRTQNGSPAPIAQPNYGQPTQPAATMPAPAIMAQQPVAAAQPMVPPQQQQFAAQPAPNAILPSAVKPPLGPATGGNPPMGLDGYCAVTLVEKQQWTQGDRRWGAIHRGRTYLFTGPEEQRRFLADPDRFAPAVSGNDVVLAAEQGRPVPGMREHGVFYNNRIFLFAGEDTLEKFSRNPAVYATPSLGAMRTPNASGTVLQ
jgi:protein disulfide-isomerase